MKVYKDGMTLGRETGSLTNALMENLTREIKVGDSFAILGWTDRTLYQVTEVVSQNEFSACKVDTYMKEWQDGTEYPNVGADGKWVLYGRTVKFKKCRKYWYEHWLGIDGIPHKMGRKVHFSWGATTGYRDPSF